MKPSIASFHPKSGNRHLPLAAALILVLFLAAPGVSSAGRLTPQPTQPAPSASPSPPQPGTSVMPQQSEIGLPTVELHCERTSNSKETFLVKNWSGTDIPAGKTVEWSIFGPSLPGFNTGGIQKLYLYEKGSHKLMDKLPPYGRIVLQPSKKSLQYGSTCTAKVPGVRPSSKQNRTR